MLIDHIGIVVKNIESSRTKYEDLLGFKSVTEVILDSIQKVKVQFLQNHNGDRIELVEPLDKSSPSWNALKKGGGVNHICYHCDDIELILKECRENHCIVVCEPVIGAGVDGRRIAFIVNPEMGLIEFVEAKKNEYKK